MVVVRGKWTSEALEEVIDAIGIGTCFLWRANKSWNIHLSSPCGHLNGWTKSIKNGPRRSVNKRKWCNNHCLDFSCVGMQLVHIPTLVKYEGCRVDTNNIYIIFGMVYQGIVGGFGLNINKLKVRIHMVQIHFTWSYEFGPRSWKHDHFIRPYISCPSPFKCFMFCVIENNIKNDKYTTMAKSKYMELNKITLVGWVD